MNTKKKNNGYIEMSDGVYYTIPALQAKYEVSRSYIYNTRKKYGIKQIEIGDMVLYKDDERFAKNYIVEQRKVNIGKIRMKQMNYSTLTLEVQKQTQKVIDLTNALERINNKLIDIETKLNLANEMIKSPFSKREEVYSKTIN